MNIPTTPPVTRADRIRLTTQTFRTAARCVRSKYRRRNPLARGVADCIALRNASLEALTRSAPAALVSALTDEEALLTRLGFLRTSKLDRTSALAALAKARRDLRAALASLNTGEST